MKAVQLTDDEIKAVILSNTYNWDPSKTEEWAEKIERLKYLNKRLNDKKVDDNKVEATPAPVGWEK